MIWTIAIIAVVIFTGIGVIAAIGGSVKGDGIACNDTNQGWKEDQLPDVGSLQRKGDRQGSKQGD